MTQLIGESLLGFSVVLATPLLLYLLAFRNNRSIGIIFSLIIGSYILLAYTIILGMAHLFNGLLILALSLATAIFIWLSLRKSKLTNVESVGIDRSQLLLILLFFLFLLGLQISRQCFSSDTFGGYLPLARIIANEQAIPAFTLQNYSDYAISKMPLLYTYIAFLFALFKTTAENLSLGIPLFFTLSTVFLLYTWGKEYRDKNVAIFIIIALLLSKSFYSLSPLVLQESTLLFFATALFYLLFKYVKTRNSLYLILLSASSSLLILTKESGIILSVLVLLGLLVKSRSKKEVVHIFTVFLLFNSLSLVWLGRNFYYYGNPVFPFFAQLFGGELNHYSELLAAMCQLYIAESYIPPLSFVRDIFLHFLAIIFAFIYMFKNWRKFEVHLVLASYILVILAMTVTAPRLLVRYLYPLMGVLALFAAVEMSKMYDIVLPKFMKLNKDKIAKAAVIIGIIALLLIALRPHPSPNRYDYENDLLSFLQQHEGATDVRIFGDSEVDALDWYGNYTMMRPLSLLFIVLNNGEPFYLDRNSEYYFSVFRTMDVKYVYDNPRVHAIDQIFIGINDDEEHFNLVYDKNGIRLWEVR